MTIANTGNRDIRITAMATAGNRTFSHNGTNCLLPRGKQMTVKISYAAGATAGNESDTLNITSDADTPSLSISLVGQSLGTTGTPDNGDTDPGDGNTTPDTGRTTPDAGGGGGGGSGGCFIISLK